MGAVFVYLAIVVVVVFVASMVTMPLKRRIEECKAKSDEDGQKYWERWVEVTWWITATIATVFALGLFPG